jgi:hypothetical protein
MTTKICNKCGRTLDICQFSRDKHQYDGRACYCKECLRERNKKYVSLKEKGLKPSLARFSSVELLLEVELRLKYNKI